MQADRVLRLKHLQDKHYELFQKAAEKGREFDVAQAKLDDLNNNNPGAPANAAADRAANKAFKKYEIDVIDAEIILDKARADRDAADQERDAAEQAYIDERANYGAAGHLNLPEAGKEPVVKSEADGKATVKVEKRKTHTTYAPKYNPNLTVGQRFANAGTGFFGGLLAGPMMSIGGIGGGLAAPFTGLSYGAAGYEVKAKTWTPL